jgi:hypothetical protein
MRYVAKHRIVAAALSPRKHRLAPDKLTAPMTLHRSETTSE